MEHDKTLLSHARGWGARYSQNLKDCVHPPEAAGRDFQVEAMKGFAIILVVLSHAIRLYIGQPQTLFWRNVFYSFHMPLFFFLSGYVACASVRKYTTGKLLGKRFKSLIVPFLSWYFLFGAVATLMYRDYGFARYTSFIISNPYTGRWFLLVLFFCFVALLIAVGLEKYLKVSAFLLVLLAINFIPALFGYKSPVAFLGLAPLQEVLIFFFVGYLLARYKEDIKGFLKRKNLGVPLKVVALLTFPLLILLGLVSTKLADGLFGTYMATVPDLFNANHLIAVLVAFVGIAFVFSVFKAKRTRRGIGWLAWLGGYSLDIYVIHSAANYFIIRIMSGPLATASTAARLLVLMLLTLCAILFSLFVSIFFLRQSRITAFLFLGRSPRKTERAQRRVPGPAGALGDGHRKSREAIIPGEA